MMPGHVPPGGPLHQGRRQMDHQHQHQHQHPHQYHYPPQTHSPVHHTHNPYAQPYMPQHYGPPYGYPQQMHQMQHMQQWNPYHQPQPQPQYAMPPRQFQPQASPVVVSSHPHMAALPPVNRSLGQTPPIVHSHTPPVQRIQTPQRAPSTPSVHSQVHMNPPTPPAPAHPTIASPPSVPETKPVHTATATATATAPLPSPPQPATFTPFYPPLPWLSVPDADFPARTAGRRRRRRGLVPAQEQGLALPSRGQDVQEHVKTVDEVGDGEHTSTGEPEESQASTVAAPSDAEVDTPSTSHPPSEIDLPSVQQSAAQTSAAAPKHNRNTTKPAVPLIPVKPTKAPSAASTTHKSARSPLAEKPQSKAIDEAAPPAPETAATAEETPKPAAPAAPKSWAELLRAKAAAAAPQAQAQAPVVPNGATSTNGPAAPKSNSLADVLASYSVDAEKKVTFLEPRGLVNTGNLCYMNSVLQVLLFCVPFYDFLDQTAKRAVHSFKSETPLVDAMIMFLRDFKTIDSANSVEQLRLRLKTDELEQYGDPLTPEYVYDTIRRLPRFDNMKRGSQEDAEEFLGFLLAGLHDDCAHVIKKGKNDAHQNGTSPKTERSNSADGGWLEVTAKQKTSLTQSSGAVEVETPITKIFGGKLRSEYKKPGEKPSVTFEPYQPLQLDIGEPHINNISDALKNLTRLETLDSAVRGARASTKQVHIETLPPVLILHLKRFHYDEKGPQKIWKKIGYPLELEIPKEVFPQHKRGGYQAQGGFPKYRLTGVVYHHGKNASGGHYTVDLRRQEGKEWIRMDDTIIRRIRAEDVAEGGAEEDPKLLAAALEQHKNDAGKSKNFFAQIDIDEEASDKGGWNQVNGTDKKENTKKWAGVVNGTATPNSAGKRTPLTKENVRDNKVAYILFYQRIES